MRSQFFVIGNKNAGNVLCIHGAFGDMTENMQTYDIRAVRRVLFGIALEPFLCGQVLTKAA